MSDSASIMPEHPPVTDWVRDFDHTDPRWTENPFPIWEELRAASPVVHTDRFLGCYMPTTYQAVKEIAYDTEHFSSRRVIVRDVRPEITAKAPPKVGSHYHIALKASDRTYEELKARLNAANEKFRETDHGYCKSIYTMSPDGMILEFTRDPPDVAEIDAMRRADAHSELARWLAGDDGRGRRRRRAPSP